MTAALSLEKAPVRYVEVGDIGRNTALIPGGTGSVEMSGEIEVCGIRWTPDDGEAHSCTIGAALALELCPTERR